MADAKTRILIVDDQGSVLFVLGEALAELGSEYQITTTQSGLEALEQMMEAPVDLLITDLRMPDIDGMQLTEYVAAHSPQTIVIWITAYGCDKVRDEMTRLGVRRCVDKPVEVHEIVHVAREALGIISDGAPHGKGRCSSAPARILPRGDVRCQVDSDIC